MMVAKLLYFLHKNIVRCSASFICFHAVGRRGAGLLRGGGAPRRLDSDHEPFTMPSSSPLLSSAGSVCSFLSHSFLFFPTGLTFLAWSHAHQPALLPNLRLLLLLPGSAFAISNTHAHTRTEARYHGLPPIYALCRPPCVLC